MPRAPALCTAGSATLQRGQGTPSPKSPGLPPAPHKSLWDLMFSTATAPPPFHFTTTISVSKQDLANKQGFLIRAVGAHRLPADTRLFPKMKKKKIINPSLHCIKAREPGEALINPHQPAEGNCTARQTFLFREKPYRKPISSPSDKIRGRERAVELMGQEGAVCKPSLSGTVVIIPQHIAIVP